VVVRPLILLFLSAIAGPGLMAQQYAPKDVLVSDFQRQKVVLLRYIEIMPEDKLPFAPTEGVRTFAGQIAHIASETGRVLAEIAQHGPQPFGDSTFYLRNKSALRDYVIRNYDFAIAGVQSLRAVQMVRTSDLHDIEWPNWKWILAAQEHAAWILGVTAIYLRLNGLQAPEYLPF
jgi:hypothetical protein